MITDEEIWNEGERCERFDHNFKHGFFAGGKFVRKKMNEYINQSDAFRRASDKQFLSVVEENAALRAENDRLQKEVCKLQDTIDDLNEMIDNDYSG